MNSNYQWQKHQANEQIQARVREAQIHRSLKSNKKERQHPFQSFGRIDFSQAFGIVSMMKRLVTRGRSNKSQATHTV